MQNEPFDGKPALQSVKTGAGLLLKWLLLAAATGTALGLVGVAFHYAVDFAQELRLQYGFFLYLLPIIGLLIVLLYRRAGITEDPGANAALESALSGKPIPRRIAPLIFVSTALTHLGGGSAGREGAALQLGASIAGLFSRGLRLGRGDARVLTMCGMSAAFSALFGTPVTAAVFAVTVASMGTIQYAALLPSMVSALTGHFLAMLCGVAPTRFALAFVPAVTARNLVLVLALGLAAGLLALLFCETLRWTHAQAQKRIPNAYLRVAAGGAVVVLAALALGTRDYSGAGMDVIARAIAEGTARPWDFAVKLLLTAVTMAVGFRGGEIVPAFFIGATFGAVVGNIIGIPAGFAAAVGLITVFCGVTNCPLTATLLSVELFGGAGLPLFALAAAAGYLVSGNISLYRAQRITLSKWMVAKLPSREDEAELEAD